MFEINVRVFADEASECTVSTQEEVRPTQTGTPAPAPQSGYAAAVLEILTRQHYSFAVTGAQAIAVADPVGVTATINTANLDTGCFVEGGDYYIFATVENGVSSYAVSLNKEFDKSHLLGGFHYGKNRCVNENLQPVNSSGKERGTGWEANVYDGILPFSLWTLAHRPKCNPAGMVQLPSGLWVDIYQSSDDGKGGLVSAHNAMPLTSKSWYDFNELALAKGKRLLSYREWCDMAMGSPQGLDDSNENAWSAEDNNGKQKTGYVANAVSSVGCRDAVGNVWEWLDTLTNDPDGGDWRWWDKMPGYGQLFMAGSTGIAALFAGGSWYNGVRAGARAVILNNYPWYVYTGIGARCACDSL